ncbi:hypothetical protein KB874_17315 [Aestuariicoccus sp. KMU-90]|uniref:HPt domain-containing protein n=2 Tax=Thetidibacter halocola TaxID=2827239 RepID=A0A8J7WIF2_9RHOB|nr:hypothetical protein [Thetidibacter halocola]MBS0125846.1 hypothetical protein [Thetidibacter halocola]
MDAAQLEALCTDLGPRGAEDAVCRAMEQLGDRLFRVQQLAFEERPLALYDTLEDLSGIADRIGLCGLAQVARHVMHCVERNDPVALSATLARLARIGERSLSALWDLQDVSV